MSITEEQRDRICCTAINSYLFDKVWNEAVSEYRINIKPYLLKKSSVTGSFSVLDANIILPSTSESYFIYAISPDKFLPGLRLPTTEWVDLATILTKYRTLLHVYTHTGKMLHKSGVYLRYNRSRSMIYMAIRKQMIQRLDVLDELDNIFITVYYDSDIENSITVVSFCANTKKWASSFQQIMQDALDKVQRECTCTIYKNGEEYPGVEVPAFTYNDWIDIVVDENISFAFDVELTETSENYSFLSIKDNTWKQLIHIPKELNPDNKVITHNTCDIYVRRKYEPIYGRYLHRATYGRTVTQVTHNDFGIPLFILDTYRDRIDTEEITLHIKVRIHDKDNTLIRDASYIDLLYKHSDLDIVNILVGNGPITEPYKSKWSTDLNFWLAANLESSKYVEMMFDTPNLATLEHMRDYVEALGFYQVVNLLCHRIHDTVVTDAYKGSLRYPLPVLYVGYSVFPVVYLNGRKIYSDLISYTLNTDDYTCTVTIDPSVATKVGDKLSVIFYISGDSSIVEFTPSAVSLSATIPYTDMHVYRRVRSIDVGGVRSVGSTSTYVYEELSRTNSDYLVVDNDDGTASVVLSPTYIGSTIVIQPVYCTYRSTYNLASYTSNGLPISIRLEGKKYESSETLPILNYSNMSVYLNGDYLVKGIDYLVCPIRDTQDKIAYYELELQTMDHFLEGEQDILDIIINVAEVEDISKGYVIDDIIRDETPVNLYFPNISTVHVAGRLERSIDYQGLTIQLPAGKYKTGDIFEVQTSVPSLVKNFITKWINNTDLERIDVLNKYFYDDDPVHKDVLVLEDQHRIYSTFMSVLLYNVATETIGIAVDPDVNRMEEQIQQFTYLKAMDLCYDETLDLRFIDKYPQYVNYEVTPSLKRVIDNLIYLFMAKNSTPTLEVVTDG